MYAETLSRSKLVDQHSIPSHGASRKSRSSSTAAAIFRRDHRAPRPARGEFAKAGNAEAEKSINAVEDQFRVTSCSLRARGLSTEDPPGRASNRHPDASTPHGNSSKQGLYGHLNRYRSSKLYLTVPVQTPTAS